MRSIEIKKSVAEKLLAQRRQIMESHASQSALACYVSPQGHSSANREHTSALQPWVEEEFLQSDAQVLLLKGVGGSGKSTFNQQLLCTLWQDKAWDEFKPGDPPPRALAPIWIPLGSNTVDPERLFNYLSQLPEPFTEEEINILKSDYRLLLIADGYDEIPGARQINLYDANQLGRYAGRVKVLISARIEEHAGEESTYFVPHRADGRLAWPLYKERYVAAFDASQRTDYITQYLAKHKTEKDSTLWPDAATYERHFAAIPGLEILIGIPFVLMMAVEALPRIVIEADGVLEVDSPESKAKKLKYESKFAENPLSLSEDKISHKRLSLVRIPTQGGGDCALHAILGEWNPSERQLVCGDIKGKREQIRSAIVNKDSKEPLQGLIVAGIKELVMSGRHIGESSQALINHYRRFISDQKDFSSVLWPRFEVVLQQHPPILEYIQKKHRLSGDSSLRDQFYDALNQNEGELYGRILSLPVLHEAFQEYSQLQNTEFDWDSAISAQVKQEYAVFVGTSHVWLLPSELAIIANVFHVSVTYYPSPDALPLTLNAGEPSTITVQFNGSDHFERLQLHKNMTVTLLPSDQVPPAVYQEITSKKGHIPLKLKGLETQSEEKRIEKTETLQRLHLTRAKLYDHFMASWFQRQADKAATTGETLKDLEGLFGPEVVAELKAEESTEPFAKRLLKRGYTDFCQSFAQHLQVQGCMTLRYPVEEKQGRLSKKPKKLEETDESLTSTLSVPTEEKAVTASPSILPLSILFSTESRDWALIRKGCPLYQERAHEYGFFHPSFVDYFISTMIVQQSIQLVGSEPVSETPVALTEAQPHIDTNTKEKKVAVQDDHALTSIGESEKKEEKIFPIPKSKRPGRSTRTRTTNPLTQRLLARESIRFLADRVDQDRQFEKSLWDWIERSKSEDSPSITIAAANAITALNAANRSFSDKDFNGIRIPGADLTGGIFHGAQLRQADLTGVNFTGAYLEAANVNHSRLSGIILNKRPTLRGHSMLLPITCMAYDKSNHLAATGGGDLNKDNAIRIWDIQRGQLIGMLVGHSEQVIQVLFIPGQINPQLISLSKDNTIRFWHVKEEKEVRRLSSTVSLQGGACISPKGRFLAVHCEAKSSGTDDEDSEEKSLYARSAMLGLASPFLKFLEVLAKKKSQPSIQLLDLTSGEILHNFNPHSGENLAFQCSPVGDSFLLATSDIDKQLKLWDLTRPTDPKLCWEQSLSSIRSIHFLEDGTGILVGNAEGISLYEATKGEFIRTYRPTGLKKDIYSIASQLNEDADEPLIAAGDSENIEVWNKDTGESVTVLFGHTKSVGGLFFASSERLLISTSEDSSIRLWPTQAFKKTYQIQPMHTRPITCMALTPDENTLITGSLDGTIRLWNAKKGNLKKTLLISPAGIKTLILLKSGQQVAIGDSTGVIYLLSLLTYEILVSLQEHSTEITAFASCERGWRNILISGDKNGKIIIWDLHKNQKMKVLADENLKSFSTSAELSSIISLSVTHEGEYVCSLDQNFGLLIWNIDSGRFHAPAADKKATECFALDKERQLILSAKKEDRQLRLRHVNSSAILQTWAGHQADINNIYFMNVNQWISSDVDGQILIWNQESESPKSSLKLASDVKSIATTTDGRWLFACQHRDNSLFAYQLDEHSAQARLTWRHGFNFDARNLDYSNAVGLTKVDSNILIASGALSDFIEDSKSTSQESIIAEDRYLVDDRGDTSLIRAIKRKDKITIEKLLKAGVYLEQAHFSNQTPLLAAFEEGYEEIVDLLIKYKANVNHKVSQKVSTLESLVDVSIFGLTPLAIAVKKGYVPIVEKLLQHRAAIDQPVDNGLLPIGIAAHYGHVPVLKVLLEHKATVSQYGSQYLPLLTMAAGQGREQAVSFLIENKAVIDQVSRDSNQASALIYAAKEGHAKTVDLLLKQGAKVNRGTKTGTTALIFAVQDGHLSAVRSLLAGKAIATQRDRSGLSPLIASTQQGDPDLLNALLEYKAIVDVAQQRIEILTALVLASQNGHDAIVKILLTLKINVNQSLPNGAFPLSVAAQYGHEKIVNLLLQSKADIHQKALSNFVSPIWLASQENRIGVIKLLLDSDANIDDADSNGSTPLTMAAYKGNLESARLLIERKACINLEAKGVLRVNPLMATAQQGHVNLLQTLIERKADINLGNVNGETALFMAALGGQENIAKILLSSKADVNQTTHKEGFSALFMAAQTGQDRIIELLLQHKAEINLGKKQDGSTPLLIAAQKGNESVVDTLLQAKADVNLGDNKGIGVPLLFASATGHNGIVQKLIEQKADLNYASTQGGITPLAVSIGQNHLEVVETLLKGKASVNLNQAEQDGSTPLMYACMKGKSRVRLVKLLLEHKAQINQETKAGNPPFFLFLENGDPEIITTLIENKADINHIGQDGVTSVLVAAQHGHHEIVKILLAARANMDMATHAGWTPLMAAVWKGQIAVVKLLLEVKANIHQKSTQPFEEFSIDSTPVAIAAKEDNEELVKLLVENKAEPPVARQKKSDTADTADDEMMQFIMAMYNRLEGQRQQQSRGERFRLPQPIQPSGVVIEEMPDDDIEINPDTESKEATILQTAADEKEPESPPLSFMDMMSSQSLSATASTQVSSNLLGLFSQHGAATARQSIQPEDSEVLLYPAPSQSESGDSSLTTPLLVGPPQQRYSDSSTTPASLPRSQFGQRTNLFQLRQVPASENELVSLPEDSPNPDLQSTPQKKSCCQCVML